MSLEEEKMKIGSNLNEEEQCEERNRERARVDSKNLSRWRNRSRSRIQTLIGSLYTPLKCVGRLEFKNALIKTSQSDAKLKKHEQLKEGEGRTNDGGDCDCDKYCSLSRKRRKNLIDSLQAAMKCLGKELKNAAINSAQIYCYTCAFYYHFLLQRLGSPLPPPPISINEINELILNMNGATADTPADHGPCSTCDGESQSDKEILPCGHRFHGVCISIWFENNNCCPLCRFMLHDVDATMSHNEDMQGNDEDTSTQTFNTEK